MDLASPLLHTLSLIPLPALCQIFSRVSFFSICNLYFYFQIRILHFPPFHFVCQHLFFLFTFLPKFHGFSMESLAKLYWKPPFYTFSTQLLQLFVILNFFLKFHFFALPHPYPKILRFSRKVLEQNALKTVFFKLSSFTCKVKPKVKAAFVLRNFVFPFGKVVANVKSHSASFKTRCFLRK